MSPSRDLTYRVSSLLLQAILAAVASTDARGSLVTEHRPGDTISTSSGNRAESTSRREWLLLTEDAADALSPGFDHCLSYFSTSFLTADLFLDFLFVNSDILSLPTLVMPDSLKCLTCPFLPTLLRGWVHKLLHPTCSRPLCACGPGELRLLSQSSLLSRAIAALPAPSTTIWTRAS